ncbi:GYD domain-containing protein [Paraburkholderia adhaesiva]|uniref:GYD domain-containing protein n=1 Tax=Paraburkholderia adhaesiva TaxID=2883244 RepID=UPI001F17811E|nr:GYD domain-containing protein [Paraburkholderia adhaesiva]
MGTYVVLAQFTDQGIRTVKNSPQRADQTAEMGKAFGCEVKDIYWTLGQYDLTIILEAKDDESLTAFGLALGSAGNVRTQTMRAFNRSEFGSLISKLP